MQNLVRIGGLVSYRMAPLPATFSDLEGHFRCLKPLHLTCIRQYIVYYLRYLYTWVEKRTWLVISTIVLKTNYFLKSQPVTYTENVVISRKRCQIASLLLQTTDRKWYMTYRIEAILMTLSHLQGHSYCKPFRCNFYALDATLVRYLLSLRVCPPSVRPFVTSRCTTKTTKC